MDKRRRTTAGKIRVLEGLQLIQRRPEMYVGDLRMKPPGGAYFMAAVTARSLALVPWGATRVVVTLHNDGAASVEAGNVELPIEPFSHEGVTRPRFDVYMTTILPGFASPRYYVEWGPLLGYGAILNALSEKLVVRTSHGQTWYRASFSEGGYVSLLREWQPRVGNGTAVTFLPVRRGRPAKWDLRALRAAIEGCPDEGPYCRIEVKKGGAASWE